MGQSLPQRDASLLDFFTVKILLNHETHERHEKNVLCVFAPLRLCVRNALVSANFHSWGAA
jgi:hypothetical protein